MTPHKLAKITRAVLQYAMIESSSDFIVAAYEIGKKTDTELVQKIDSVLRWEYYNWHDNTRSNISYIDKKLQNLDKSDYAEVSKSYSDILEYFLEDETVSSVFCMDKKDHIGWKIYKELDEKRRLATKYFNIINTARI